jgi:hypothetical protein
MLSLKVEVEVWSTESDYMFACIGVIYDTDFMHATELYEYRELQHSPLTQHSNRCKL